MAEKIRRYLVRLLGGVVREQVVVKVVPPALMNAIRLADGLISAGKVDEAQKQLRMAFLCWHREHKERGE